MFETQHYMELNPDTPKKRGREDEQEFQPGATSFSEHRNVRLECQSWEELILTMIETAAKSACQDIASRRQLRHSIRRLTRTVPTLPHRSTHIYAIRASNRARH